jgi:hypothetical protein
LNDSLTLSKSVKENIQFITQTLGSPADLVSEVVGADASIGVIYFSTLIDRNQLGLALGQLRRLPCNQVITLKNLMDSLCGYNPIRVEDPEQIISMVTSGLSVIFIEGVTSTIAFSTPGSVKRPPKEPQSERAIRGPREGFTETIEDNIGLVRRYIKDPHLRVEQIQIGRRTRSKVAVVYLSNVAKPSLVKEVYKRLSAIDIDGVVESGYIEQLIKDRRLSIFPLTQATERSDKVAAAVLEGRVSIMVDRSPSVIIVPVTVNELYQSPEDYYFDFWLGSFLRLLRLFSNNLAVALPALFVALVAVNPELLPTNLALSIAVSRMRIPIPLVAEVLLLELTVEIFREAGLRLPGASGQTLGVVAGVVLGFTGIQAGIVSPTTLLIVAITSIASFTGPNYSVGITWRLLKYILILAAATLGLYGLVIAGMLILIHAADIKSFGVPYLAPWAPIIWRDLLDGPIRFPFWTRSTRPLTWDPQDKLRAKKRRKKDWDKDEK